MSHLFTTAENRQPMRDLPMSLFVKPEMGPPLLAQQFKLGAKRPFSPSSFISPSKRKLLAVEGILSPKSTPFRRVVRDLKNALPSPAPLRLPLLKSPVKHLVPQGSPRSPVTPSTPPPLNSKKRKFGLDDSPNELLSPSPSVGKDTRPLRKPRTPTIHTSQEAQLLAMLNAAPLPSEKPATPDEEDEHYPGFDVYVDEEEESSETPHFTSDIIDDEEDKENKAPVKEFKPFIFGGSRTVSRQSSVASFSAARAALQREVDDDADTDSDWL